MRIEKLWGNIFGQTGVKKTEKVLPEAIEGAPDKQGGNPYQQQHEQQSRKDQKADQESVEKAISELKNEEKFVATGMGVEMLASKNGISVRLMHANGSVIKIMSAEEFLRLRDSSDGDNIVRGKILDQKY